MSEKDQGGFAFPILDGPHTYSTNGMTLRDYFAGQALSGLLATASGFETTTKAQRDVMFGKAAGLIYEIADAMIAERNK